MTSSGFPLRLNIDYSETPNRLTVFFRLIVSIPILIVAFAVGALQNGGTQILGPLLMIVFREKYPRWLFDWNLAMTRFTTRLWAYIFLITHVYPSTDDEQSVYLDFEYPDVQNDLNRWLPLVKWFLAIPHIILAIVLFLLLLLASLLTWFAILLTGRAPRRLFDFQVGVLRYGTRLSMYAFILTTDKYPPFSIQE
jgi:hypothetical protein